MLKELRTSQLLEYKKLLKIVLEGIDSAISIRSGLLEYDSVSKYEHAKYDTLNDPEPYYHIKMFDKAIGIVRLYSPKEWNIEDQDKKYFHFAIRCYNFHPFEIFNLSVKPTQNYTTYGEFLSIEDSFNYFFKFVKQLFLDVLHVEQKELFAMEVY